MGTSFVPRDPFDFKGVTEGLSDFGRLDDQESGRGKDSVGAVRFARVAEERFAPDMSILGRLGDERFRPGAAMLGVRELERLALDECELGRVKLGECERDEPVLRRLNVGEWECDPCVLERVYVCPLDRGELGARTVDREKDGER